jgi:simple sugar transport system permease protein
VLSVVAAFVVGGIFLLFTDHSPITVYRELVKAGFTTFYGITDTLAVATPLIFTGLAAAFAMRMNLYNIGGEGQLYAGAMASSAAALALGDSAPAPVAVGVTLVAGALGGMIWMAIPAITRATRGASEIITTLLFNYLALYLMRYLIFGSASYWRDKEVTSFPQGRRIPEVAQLAPFGSTRVTAAVLIALVAVLAVWFVNRRTSLGYDMSVVADAEHAARYAGIPTRRMVLTVLLISGGLAGLAGASEVSGRAYALDPNGLELGLGYSGIVIAALARTNPFGVAVGAIALGGLQNAGTSLQSLPGERVPIAISQMLQGAILLFALGGEVFRRNRLVVRRIPAEQAAAA